MLNILQCKGVSVPSVRTLPFLGVHVNTFSSNFLPLRSMLLYRKGKGVWTLCLTEYIAVSYTHLDVYKRQVHAYFEYLDKSAYQSGIISAIRFRTSLEQVCRAKQRLCWETKWLAGKRFTDCNQVSNAVHAYFEYLDKSAYQSGIISAICFRTSFEQVCRAKQRLCWETKWLAGKRFTDCNQVSNAVHAYLEYLDKSAYQSGIILSLKHI